MKKFIVALLTSVCAVCASVGFTACDKSDEQEGQYDGGYTIQAAYAKAGELGYTGTLEEFIATISGKDGVDGKDGIDGKDGLGIEDVSFNSKGELVVTFTDETSKNLGTIIRACEHEWSDWETVREATCTSIGYNTRVCGICGVTDYEFVAETGHDWNEGWEYDGFTVKTCNVCNAPLFLSATQYEFISPVTSVNLNESGDDLYFVCEAEDKVVAVLDGTVTAVGYDENGGYVELEHFGGFKTVYRRVVALDSVKVGNKVARGETICIVSAASSSSAQKPCLYFELYLDGERVSPSDYMDVLPVIFVLPVDEVEILHGYNEVFYNELFARFESHGALDFACALGDNVYAAADGTVTEILSVIENAVDVLHITVQHDKGYKTVYKYVSAVENLKVGDKVNRGELIGFVSEPTYTEKDFGVHLHFEMYLKNGMVEYSIDPSDYLDI